MDRNNKILAAVDLDAGTERILAYALWFAKLGVAGASEISMLHVMDYALTPPAYLMPYIEKERAASEEILKDWQQKLKGFGVNSELRIAIGRLVESFSSTIKEQDISMLVLGHKSHMIRPSSSERLIKSLGIPMLVIRGQKSEGVKTDSVNIKKILCAVDFSDGSKKAVEFARTLSEASSSDLIITTIVSRLKIEESFKRLRGMSEADRDNYKKHVLREAEEKICSVLQVCGGAENVVRMGVPYRTINEIALEKDADLVVIGARGLSYIKGLMLGSVAEAIVKSSPCPVMIVH